MNIYSHLGHRKISLIIKEFYHLAFQDPIIGHFFFRKKHEEILPGQIAFTASMLGSRHTPYHGPDIRKLHHPLKIKNAHFNRRHILLQQQMRKHGVDEKIIHNWLQKEQRLRSQIIPIAVKSAGVGTITAPCNRKET